MLWSITSEKGHERKPFNHKHITILLLAATCISYLIAFCPKTQCGCSPFSQWDHIILYNKIGNHDKFVQFQFCTSYEHQHTSTYINKGTVVKPN